MRLGQGQCLGVALQVGAAGGAARVPMHPTDDQRLRRRQAGGRQALDTAANCSKGSHTYLRG